MKDCLNCYISFKGTGKTGLCQSCAGKRSKLSEKNPQWKGDNVGYNGIHNWIKRRKIKPKFCEDCKKTSPYDLANISQQYKRDVDDWEFLCRKCHMKKDGRLKKFMIMAKKKGKKSPFLGKHLSEEAKKILKKKAIKRYKNPKNHPRWKGGLPLCIKCKKQLTHYHTKKCRKCSDNFGKNNHNWRGGTSFKYRQMKKL